MLGPLVHPAQPKHNFFGVYSNSLSRLYQFILKKQDRKFAVVYNLDGYDEISLTDDFMIRSDSYSKTFSPDSLGLPNYHDADLYGGDDVSANAKIFMDVLQNEASQAQKDVVTANAGYAISLYHENMSVVEGIEKAKESIESGTALQNFKKLLN